MFSTTFGPIPLNANITSESIDNCSNTCPTVSKLDSTKMVLIRSVRQSASLNEKLYADSGIPARTTSSLALLSASSASCISSLLSSTELTKLVKVLYSSGITGLPSSILPKVISTLSMSDSNSTASLP